MQTHTVNQALENVLHKNAIRLAIGTEYKVDYMVFSMEKKRQPKFTRTHTYTGTYFGIAFCIDCLVCIYGLIIRDP